LDTQGLEKLDFGLPTESLLLQGEKLMRRDRVDEICTFECIGKE
jgi:hypothetical protein